MGEFHRDPLHGLDSVQSLAQAAGSDRTIEELIDEWAATVALDGILDDGAKLNGGTSRRLPGADARRHDQLGHRPDVQLARCPAERVGLRPAPRRVGPVPRGRRHRQHRVQRRVGAPDAPDRVGRRPCTAHPGGRRRAVLGHRGQPRPVDRPAGHGAGHIAGLDVRGELEPRGRVRLRLRPGLDRRRRVVHADRVHGPGARRRPVGPGVQWGIERVHRARRAICPRSRDRPS